MKHMERDFRFLMDIARRKKFLEECFIMFTPDDLKNIIKAAEKLEIENFCSMPAVDVLYEVAGKLAILEAERVEPHMIMDKINEYLKAN